MNLRLNLGYNVSVMGKDGRMEDIKSFVLSCFPKPSNGALSFPFPFQSLRLTFVL